MQDELRFALAWALFQAWCLTDGAQYAVRRAAAALPPEEGEPLWQIAAELGTASAAIVAFLERRGFPAPPPPLDTARPTPGGVN